MSISSEINRISGNVSDALTAIANKGVTVPSGSNSDDLADLIGQISGGSPSYTWETEWSGTVRIVDWGEAPWYYVYLEDYFLDHSTIVQGETYRITWNGNQYVCVAQEILDTGGQGYVLGNAILDGGTTGNNEPFVAQQYFDTDLLFSTQETSATPPFTLVIEKQVSGGGGSTLVSKTITQNGTYDPADDNADGYSEVIVNVSGGTPNLQAKTNISPTTSSQTITADSGYDGLSSVQINAMPTGTAGTPTATKGTVSNHSVSVTPSVTNTGGVISGGTLTGTPVTVSASELVSGSETKTSNGTYDVTNLASLVVNVSGGNGIGTLLNTTSIGSVNTTSTQAASLNVSCEVSGINSYDLLIVESSVNSTTNNRHTATVGLIFLTAGTAIGTKNGATIATAKWNSKLSNTGTATTSVSTTAYGIYPNSCSISNGTATIPMYRRYNSTSTGTINGTYTARVYGVNLYDLIGG